MGDSLQLDSETKSSFRCHLTSWSSGNAFVSEAVGPGLKSRAAQISSVANSSPPLRNFLRKDICCPCAMTRRCAPQTRYTLRRNTSTIMKDLIDLIWKIRLTCKCGTVVLLEFINSICSLCFECTVVLKTCKFLDKAVKLKYAVIFPLARWTNVCNKKKR